MSAQPALLNVAETYRRAVALHQAGNLPAAEGLYRSILDGEPRHFDALRLLGLVKVQQGRFDEAEELLARAVDVNPQFAEAHSDRGNVLKLLGRCEQALASFDRALALKPDFADAWSNRGITLHALERFDAALADFDRALAIDPVHVDALYNSALTLQRLQRYEEAVRSCNRALAVMPAFVEALNLRGIAQHALARSSEALASFGQALDLRPGFTQALYNRALALQGELRFEEALASYDQVVAVDPRNPDALHNRGGVLLKLKRYALALEDFDLELTLRPDAVTALRDRGAALCALGRYEDGVLSYSRALAFDPKSVAVLLQRAYALAYLRRHEEAGRDLERALELNDDLPFASGMLLHARMQCCDWREYDRLARRIARDVRSGKRSADPLTFMSISDSPSDQLVCAQTWTCANYPAMQAHSSMSVRRDRTRIHIAYLSADFRDHPTAYLMAGLFEQHDRNRFEVTGLSFGRDTAGAMRRRLEVAFERFVDVKDRTDAEVAKLLVELEVDIAVDLNGFTADARTGILALRPSPVQVNYLGFPGTMGAPYIDYLIADRFTIPEAQQDHYAEKIVRLPDTFQVNDAARQIAVSSPARGELGLPERGFVFCSFNSLYKITPAMFDCWMRLLRQVPGSVLWLVAGDLSLRTILRREAQARGVLPSRLIFAPRLAYADHLARYRAADLFLDTLPFNAGTTASDALWAGLPVLTCAGEALAARMAGSLLQAVGLPELITDSMAAYQALALRLAVEPELLVGLKQKLVANRATHPLFDTDRFRRHLEWAFVEMWQRNQRHEPPASFVVPAIA